MLIKETSRLSILLQKNDNESKSILGYTFLITLLVYHLVGTLFFYSYTQAHASDATLYWFVNAKPAGHSWFELFGYGNHLMRWLNYPFAVLLQLPLWAGTLLYSVIGYLGILQLYKLGRLFIGDYLIFKGFNLLPLLAFMPNLHFWTAGITKEVLCFYAIATILLQLQRDRIKSLAFIASWTLLIGVRPHVVFILLASIGVVYMWFIPLSRKRKLLYTLSLTTLLIFLYIMVCGIIHIHPLDIERWLANNESWRNSFMQSGSYVPIQQYSYAYKFFTFYFRPFFYDTKHMYSWVLSIENVVLLTLYGTALYQWFMNRKTIKLHYVLWSIIVFNVLGFIIYVQRYAGLGIFVRTKMMFQPFMVMVLLYILIKTIPQLSKHDKA